MDTGLSGAPAVLTGHLTFGWAYSSANLGALMTSAFGVRLADHAVNVFLSLDLALLDGLDDLLMLTICDNGNLRAVVVDDFGLFDGVAFGQNLLVIE